MATRGTGPFDSDAALDYLGGLANEVAHVDDDGDVIDGSVDVFAAESALAQVLQTQLLGDDTSRCAQMYAAAGLVAARLTGADVVGADVGLPDQVQCAGGVLGAALHKHCGYVVLLGEDNARQLRPLAETTVRRLLASAWLAEWGNLQEITGALHQVLAVLHVGDPALCA